WQLAAIPQGGIVAAIAARAMEQGLAEPAPTLRTITCMFAGQVARGPVEGDVGVPRQGRPMSQLTPTLRNPRSPAGLTAIAAFGAPRRGFDFTDLVCPVVEGPEGLRGYRDPLPDDVDPEQVPRRYMTFWDEVVECRPAMGRAPWEPFVDGP